MKNADQPAHPITRGDDIVFQGLTKREKIAAIAMAGILSNPNWTFSQAYAAEAAVGEADKLLQQLES